MVQRYDCEVNAIGEYCHGHVEREDGYYVLYSDYLVLEQERDELREMVKKFSDELDHNLKDCEYLHEKMDNLEAENATLRKRLEPIEEWWDRNCSEYIRKKHQKWDASMYEAIEKAMELKEGE